MLRATETLSNGTMNDEEERRFREFAAARSPALMRTATLLTGGDTHAAEDLLQTALAKAAERWDRLESPEAYPRQVLYRQQVSLWRLLRTRRGTTVAELPDAAGREDATSAAELRIQLRRALARPLGTRTGAVTASLRPRDALQQRGQGRADGLADQLVREFVVRRGLGVDDDQPGARLRGHPGE